MVVNGSAVALSERENGASPAHGAEVDATLYLVSPVSLESWFSYFVDEAAGDEVAFIGEQDEVDKCSIRMLLETQPASTIVVCSSHETLARDSALGDALRPYAARTIAPSATSVRVGGDKVEMKEFFDRRGFPSPGWARSADARALGSDDALVVVKRRDGTQSVGTRLARLGDCALTDDELCELYVDGVEYSVVVYRDDEHELVFPPVWKGATSELLVPPWRRLRTCPDPRLQPEREQELRRLARAIAREADVQGHLEVEYLVTPAGEALVLELNPRVSGTMRIAALAARAPIFSLHRLPPLVADLRAARCAAEVPYDGPAFADPEREVFATSRLTAAGRSFAEVRGKIESALREARVAQRAA